MALGIFFFLVALGGATYLLYRIAIDTGRSDEGADPAKKMPISRENLLKLIILFALCATLFASNLWPLAFMVLLAAGSISAVEFWKQRAINDMDRGFDRDQSSIAENSLMSTNEALHILGLEEGATREEIRLAHKKLISQLHPDKGGTDYLAAKINQARETLQ